LFEIMKASCMKKLSQIRLDTVCTRRLSLSLSLSLSA
jgi:hypothetical protein